jgi:uncharacterized protein YidB (DUF937 family)
MLDQILNGLKQGLPSSGEQSGQSRLVEAVLSWVEGNSSGLSGLIGRFQQKGLGQLVSSWISTGENLPISAAELTQGLGAENVNQIAAQAGVPPETASHQLAELLPSLIDRLTPQGHMPEGSVVSEGLRSLMTKFGGQK